MPALIGREKLSPIVQSALCKHIMLEREKRKQEAAEAEKDFERKAKEEEEKRKKLEEEHSTLEDIKEQLNKLKEKQERLRQEKHQLFWQFRRVLNEEAKQKARVREQSESSLPSGGQYQHPLNPHHMLPQGYRYQNQSPSYLSHPQQQGVKRPHSPSTSSAAGLHSRSSTTLQSPLQSSVAGIQGSYNPMHGSTPDRGNNAQHPYSNPIGKSNLPPTHVDDRSRPRISMIPPSASYSPSSGNLSAHKYPSQARTFHTKHSQ